jgi:hypothetical protein
MMTQSEAPSAAKSSPMFATYGPKRLTVLDMPVKEARTAPNFKGDYRLVEEFLDHMDMLFTQYNVFTDSEKCKSVHRYCSREVRDVIQGLESYNVANYANLRRDILKTYDAERMKKKFKKADMEEFVHKSRKKKIRNLGDFRKYCRGFLKIAGWLHGHHKVTDHEYNRAFWEGLQSSFCSRLENRILIHQPDIDLTRAFPVETIIKAAESVLQRDRFDADKELSDSETDFEEDYDSDFDSEESGTEDKGEEERAGFQG